MRGNVFSPLLTTNNLKNNLSTSTSATTNNFSTSGSYVPDDDPPIVITRVNSLNTTQSNSSFDNNKREVEKGQKDKFKEARFQFKGNREAISRLDKPAMNQESLIDVLPNLNKPDYEVPLIDCGCCEVYWTPYFAKIIKSLLGVNLQCRSKKGTPYYRIKAPKRNNKMIQWIKRSQPRKWVKESAAIARQKSINATRAIEREWMQIRPTLRWRHHDPHYLEKLEMEREIKRLRQALQETNAEDGNKVRHSSGASDYHPQSSFN